MAKAKRMILLAIPLLLAASTMWTPLAQNGQRPMAMTGVGDGAESGVEVDEDLTLQWDLSSDCSFIVDPDAFLLRASRAREALNSTTVRVGGYLVDRMALTQVQAVDANSIPRKNLIDTHIFDRMKAASIESAPIASDAEFLRRATLDLTGRIPSMAEVESFLANTAPNKRDVLVDSLTGTPEFVDKWTMFFGDLYRNNAGATNVNRYTQGRDAFHLWVKDAITRNKPYDVMATELIADTGDSFVQGNVNWVVGGTIPMGPAQDTYDGQAVQLASVFMGINTVDCLLCHDGARHLDTVNLWGAGQTRQNMWGLSAYFAQTTMRRQVVQPTPLIAKYTVTDNTNGSYRLNTTTGNRSPRQPAGGVSVINPRNPFATTSTGPVAAGSGLQSGETYRQGIARQVVADLQFSRAIVNYIWEEMMVEAFVSPSNGFDIARLDPARPPAAPWTLQPTNPELLDALARWFQQNRYDLRALISLIAKSNAYQLSAVYPGTWKLEYVPYYARKYVRRLDAEEVHDAILKATGIGVSYPMTYLPPVQWAMQLPDTREPRTNGVAVQFLNSFGRGDRDQSTRKSDGSVLQTLNMMNNTFVMSRIHQNNNGSTVSRILASNANASEIIRQLFLNTLSRPPTAAETAALLPGFQAGLRPGAESLQWMLLNKLDFLFNY